MGRIITNLNDKIFYVYLLLDTRKPVFQKNGYKFDFEPFYVGKGKKKRAVFHIWQANQTKNFDYRLNKIRKIKEETGENPEIYFYAKNLTERQSLELEQKLIQDLGRLDLKQGPLVNLTNGGEGETGYKHTLETKKHWSEIRKGRKLTKEQTKNYGKANIGRKASKETRLKQSIAAKGKSKSLEARQKMSLAKKGKKQSQSVVEQRTKKIIKKWKDKDYREKMRITMVNVYKDENLRKKMSDTLKKIMGTEEKRKQCSISAKKKWQELDYRNKCCKNVYLITDLKLNKEIKIQGLSSWCKQNNVNYPCFKKCSNKIFNDRFKVKFLYKKEKNARN